MMYFVLGLLIAYSVFITVLFVAAANLATIRKRRLKVANKRLELADNDHRNLLLQGVVDDKECRTDWPAVK